MAMEGVSPPRSAPLPLLANNEDNGIIAVNDKDNKESDVSINKSNRLHKAKEVAPMRIRVVISCAAKFLFLHIFRGSTGR